jgi:hypothetical protein
MCGHRPHLTFLGGGIDLKVNIVSATYASSTFSHEIILNTAFSLRVKVLNNIQD